MSQHYKNASWSQQQQGCAPDGGIHGANASPGDAAGSQTAALTTYAFKLMHYWVATGRAAGFSASEGRSVQTDSVAAPAPPSA